MTREILVSRPTCKDRGRQKQSSRLFPHRHVAAFDPAAEIAKRLIEQFADRERGHAHRINRQHQEPAVRIEQLAAIGDQAGERLLETLVPRFEEIDQEVTALRALRERPARRQRRRRREAAIDRG